MLTTEERSELVRAATDQPTAHTSGVESVFHHSEDGTIQMFAPHVPTSNPSQAPAVWAIDLPHSPLYWFPRNCPRISVWATSREQQVLLTELFETEAHRICATETGWLERMRAARVYRYHFDAELFHPWDEADGQYVASEVVYPTAIEPLDDLLAMHTEADVELRFTPKMGAMMDRILASGLPFSFVRIRDARR